MLSVHSLKEDEFQSLSDSTMGRVFTLHSADLVSVPGIPYGPQSPPEVISEHCQVLTTTTSSITAKDYFSRVVSNFFVFLRGHRPK